MKMEPNQRMAEDLAARLGAAGIRGRVEGGGVHWQVDAGPVGTRSVVLHCFWYDRAFSGLMLGINLANARSRLRAERAPHEGPEYLVVVRDDDDDVADGRTHDVTEAVGGARSWLAGAARDALAREAPFITTRDARCARSRRRSTPRFASRPDAIPDTRYLCTASGARAHWRRRTAGGSRVRF